MREPADLEREELHTPRRLFPFASAGAGVHVAFGDSGFVLFRVWGVRLRVDGLAYYRGLNILGGSLINIVIWTQNPIPALY